MTKILSPVGAALFILGLLVGRPIGPALFMLGFVLIVVSLVLSILRWTKKRSTSS